MYTISISRTAVLSNRIQEFGKAARPGKGEVTKIASTYVENIEKITGRILGIIPFVTIYTYSAFCCILCGKIYSVK